MHAVERGTPVAGDSAAVAALREAFVSAGYTLPGVRTVIVPAHQALGDDALTTLVRLFFLRQEVRRSAAARALAPLSVDDCAALGIAINDHEFVYGSLQIVPDQDVLLACDWDSTGADDVRFDHVMSPARSTRRLAALTARHPVAAALDLGTGCGYQAILAARHATSVIATDSNPRALAFAAFNVVLNGVDNVVECRQGDWFTPVEGLQFDLIVCNPPYVIAPERTLLYQDDPSGDLSRRLVEAVPRYLRPAGLGYVLVGWTHAADVHWAQPLSTWVAESRCDAWLFREASYDPATHAAMWNSGLFSDPRRYADAIERWTRHFAEQGVERIADGVVVLRHRQSDAPRIRFDNLPRDELPFDAGDDLVRRIDVDDRLAGMDDAALLACAVEIVPQHRLEQVSRHRGAGFEPLRSTLILETGLGSSLTCNPEFVRLLATIDGRRSLAEVITSADETFKSAALRSVRQALAHGFLRFVS